MGELDFPHKRQVEQKAFPCHERYVETFKCVLIKCHFYRLGKCLCAGNATSGDIVTTLASVATVAVAHPTSRRCWFKIAGSPVCHLILQRGLRQWTQSVLASSWVVGPSSARRSPPDGRNQKTMCKFTITKIKIMFDLVRYCCTTTFEALYNEILFVNTKNKFERITFRSAPLRDADEQRISHLFTVGGIV